MPEGVWVRYYPVADLRGYRGMTLPPLPRQPSVSSAAWQVSVMEVIIDTLSVSVYFIAICYTSTSYICFVIVVGWFCSTFYLRDDAFAFKTNSWTVKIVPRRHLKSPFWDPKSIEKKFCRGLRGGIVSSPTPPPQWGGDTPPHTHPIRRLDPRAYDASSLASRL